MEVFSGKTTQGLEVLTIPIKTPSVTIMALVRTGSRNEADKQAGLAHFVEHMFFKGTKNYPSSKDIGLAIENIGGYSNAFTSYEYTGYYIKIPKNNYQKAIIILGDMLANSIYSPEEIKKESGVIVEEIRMYEDIPMEKVQRIFQENLFLNNPLGRDIAGSIETVKSFKKSDFIGFRDMYYQPDNVLVVVAGDVNKGDIINEVEEAFVFNDKQSKYDNPCANKTILNNFLEVIPQKIEQSHIVLGGFANERMHKDKYPLKVATSILSHGFGSLLFQEIREKLGMAYYVRFGTQAFSDIGKYSLSMGVDTKRYKLAVESVIKVLNRMLKGDFMPEDLERAQNLLLGHYTTQLEASDDIAQFYGMQYLMNKQIETLDEIKHEIKSVTKDSIVESFAKIFSSDNISGVMLGNIAKSSEVNFNII